MPGISNTARGLRVQLARSVVTPSSELLLDGLAQEVVAVNDRIGRHLLGKFGIKVFRIHCIQLFGRPN